jgi:hypothetical protein
MLVNVVCKNTISENYLGREKRQIFTEEGIYKAIYEGCEVIVQNNYGGFYFFYLPEKDTASNKRKELWFYDWFYSKAELRQKQIDSVINGNI